MKTFHSFSTFSEEDITATWSFSNPKYPGETLSGDPRISLHPAKDSNWSAEDPIDVMVRFSVREDGNSFASLAASRLGNTVSLNAVVESISSMSERVRGDIILIQMTQGYATARLKLAGGMSPSIAKFRLAIIVDGKVVYESRSPEIRLTGTGTELDISYHDRTDWPLWKWSIEMEDPEYDRLHEGLHLSIRKGIAEQNFPVNFESGRTHLGAVQCMFWSEIIMHIFLMIERKGDSYIEMVTAPCLPDQVLEGSFIHAAHLWYTRMGAPAISMLFDNPGAFKQRIISSLLSGGSF